MRIFVLMLICFALYGASSFGQGCTGVPIITSVEGGETDMGGGVPATTAPIYPKAIATDTAGNIYFGIGKIYKITPAGLITTVAGTGTHGYSGDGGAATAAQIFVFSLAVDLVGNIYLDNDQAYIRKIDAITGVISTIAGNGTLGYSGDGGAATAANINVFNLAVDPSGNVYYGDVINKKVRKITPSGIISTAVGNGVSGYSGDGGPATLAQITSPNSIASDVFGNLFISDMSNQVIRKVNASGIISTIAGGGVYDYHINGIPATSAHITLCNALAADQVGNVYYSDGFGAPDIIRKIDLSGNVNTYAGSDSLLMTGSVSYSYDIPDGFGDGGPAIYGEFFESYGLASDGSGNLFISDERGTLRKVTPGMTPITGAMGVCQGNTITLSNATTGGTWTSSNTSVATVGSASGVVSGITPGVTVITYSSGSCSIGRSVTVYSGASSITGTASMCTGASTTLSCATSGGTWISSITGIATVGSATGIVTGVSAGTATISYSISGTCSPVRVVTVNSVPAAIGGTASFCAGSTITLTDATSGGTWSSGSTGVATVGSGTGIVTGVSSGIATITYSTGGTCYATAIVTVIAAPAAISGTATLCSGTTTTLSNSVSGGTWTSSATGIATVGSGTGIVNGVSNGTATISYTIGSGCIVTRIVTVNPGPASITGTLTLCSGATTTLANAVSGGSWSSSATGVATVGSGSGIITGVSAGTATITYSMGAGCDATAIVTVNASPAAITGTTSVCVGDVTTLSSATGSGTWSSSNTSIAIVGSGTGIVTGVASGTATITYQLGSGCSVSTSVTVNNAPASIAGPSSVCSGSTITLTNSVTGGTWSSSATGVATAGSASGVVTGVSAGTVTITYTIGGGCYTTQLVTVNASPAVIGGSSTLCTGGSTTLTNTVTGGVWTSGATGVATVGSGSGLVSGITAGTATITYTVGSCSVTKVVTVGTMPAAIVGPVSMCTNVNSVYSNATPGGTWSSSAPVSIFAGSAVSISAGIATISYSTNATCFATKSVTVYATPAPITGASLVCIGTTNTLSNTLGGGIWTSSYSSATIGSLSGVVTGVSSGLTYITYTTAGGCTAWKQLTVNLTPSAIGGASLVCTSTPVTFTNSVAGGVWSSGSTSIATVVSGSGVVTAVSGGTTVITYNNGGCIATRAVTTDIGPASISGANFVVQGYAITLTDATTGGTWSSGSTGIATVGSASGIVTGVATGLSNITYAMGTGCIVTKAVYVNYQPCAPGIITAVAGGGALISEGAPATNTYFPTFQGMTVDGAGNAYYSETGRIRKVNTSGTVATIVGTGTSGFSGDGGTATAAAINVYGMTSDASGNVYFSDISAHRIRKISSSGVISTIAGNGSSGVSGDGGPATAAQLSFCGNLTADNNGNIYYAEYTGGLIRKIDNAGIITKIAGGGIYDFHTENIPATDASLSPYSIAADGAGNVFVSDGMMSKDIRKIDPTGMISRYAGNDSMNDLVVYSYLSIPFGVGNGGTPLMAAFSQIDYLATSTNGDLFVGEVVIGQLRKITPGIAIITGTPSVCAGGSTTLSNTTSSGVWTSLSTSIATIGSGSGVVNGLAAGTSGIIYTSAGGCNAAKIVTVNASPASITGTTTLCSGATTTLSSTTTGGTWSSSNTGVATVGSATGIVTGVSAGTAMITYMLSSGCNVTATITVNSAPASITGTGSVCIGSTTSLSNAVAGGTWSSSGSGVATAGSGTGIVTGVSAGTATITYALAGSCIATTTVTVNAALPAISGAASLCVGGNTTLTNSATGGTWSSSATGVATVGSVTGIVNGISAGTSNITYSLGAGCFVTKAVTVNPLPASITGTASICVGSTTTLIDATTGGTWSSSATGIATVGSGTGIVTGVSAGTATITYTLGTGCAATTVVTVNGSPASIGGTPAVFIADTTTLTDATAGGTWSSSNTSIATIGSATGLLTGVSGGTVNITYTLPTGCFITIVATVTGAPAPISGSATLCAGSTTTFTSPSFGGTWTSSNTGVATIGSTTGVVTGVAAGTARMTYTISGTFTLRSVTVIAIPAAITGATSVCEGATITLSDATTGGTWSSSSSSVASAGSTGIITGVSAGTVTITYSTGCNPAATKAITVNPTPVVAAITGANGLCVGATTTYSDATATGVWSINSSVATIGSGTGIVTGLAISGGTVSYTVTNVYGCVNAATKYIYVEGTPGNINTFAGTGVNTTTGDGGAAYLATIQGARDIVTDNAGNIYIADVSAHVVRKISTEGLITRIAGTIATSGNTGDGGQATAATLNAPNGLYVDNTGNVYISNTNSHTIRKVNGTTGIITTIAGVSGVAGGTGDGGPASAAKLFSPLGLAGDGAGNLYIADQQNYRVRKINTNTGIITTVAGNGSNYYSGDGGQGTAARLSTPRGLALDKSGNLYISDYLNYAIRKLNTNTGIITTIAGTGTAGFTGDGGQATAAQINGPARIAYDGGNLLYLIDQTNHKIRQVNLNSGIIRTMTGTGGTGFAGDNGPALSANIWAPSGVACDKLGNMYISDANNKRIRVVATKGSIGITIAGPTTVAPGTAVSFTANASTTVNVAYQWQRNGTNVGTGLTTYTNVSPSNGDVYRCILTITPVCGSAYNDTSNSITITVTGSRQSDTTHAGIPTDAMVNLYPNPVHSSFTVVATGMDDGPADISIIDQLGKVVGSQKTEVTNNRLQEIVDMQSLVPGIYIVSVVDAGGRVVRLKCVKE